MTQERDLTAILEATARAFHENAIAGADPNAVQRVAQEEGVDSMWLPWDELSAKNRGHLREALFPTMMSVLKALDEVHPDEGPKREDLENGPFAVHFGVYDYDDGRWAMVDGHTDRAQEHEIDLPDVMKNDGVTSAFISGSWGCWGTPDQDGEGDESLHVVFISDKITPQRIADLRGVLTELLPNTQGRIVDHAIASDPEDWSQQEYICTIGGNPYVVVSKSATVDSGATSREYFEDAERVASRDVEYATPGFVEAVRNVAHEEYGLIDVLPDDLANLVAMVNKIPDVDPIEDPHRKSDKEEE